MKAKKEAEFKTLEEGPIFKKTDSTGVRISKMSVDGKECIDLRQVYKTKNSEDDEWLPTGKGFTLPTDKAAKVLKQFLKFVTELD